MTPTASPDDPGTPVAATRGSNDPRRLRRDTGHSAPSSGGVAGKWVARVAVIRPGGSAGLQIDEAAGSPPGKLHPLGCRRTPVSSGPVAVWCRPGAPAGKGHRLSRPLSPVPHRRPRGSGYGYGLATLATSGEVAPGAPTGCLLARSVTRHSAIPPAAAKDSAVDQLDCEGALRDTREFIPSAVSRDALAALRDAAHQGGVLAAGAGPFEQATLTCARNRTASSPAA